MTSAEKLLILLLRISGVIVLLAMPAALLPFKWMNTIHQAIGLGVLPDLPIIQYLTRSISLLYAMHGALLLLVSTDVRRFLPVLKFLAYASLVLGMAMIVLDLYANMPLPWVACEGPPIMVWSGVVLWLSSKVKDTEPQSAVAAGAK